MKPDWDKLGKEYADRSDVVIGDADCTASGKDLCSDQKVSGYPTIKYFDTDGEHAYKGGRDFDSLKKFVEENLVQQCLLDDQANCSDKEVKYIKKMQAKDAAAREKQVARLTKMLGNKMAPKLKKWLSQRLAILKQL